MIMVTVTSSNIAQIGWENETLYVQFTTGKTYQYDKVPESVYQAFMEAPSKGKFLNASIKGQYEFKAI